MKFENYPTKTVRENAFTVIIYYTIILKFQEIAKNTEMFRSSKNTNQVIDIILMPI